MIPILYEKTEKEFATLGLGVLNDCISCVVTEERNGIFELKMQYPADGARFSEIQKERIVVVDASRELRRQRFVIVRITRLINGIVTVYGEHIAQYITKNTTLKPHVRFYGTAQQALTTWNNALMGEERFNVSSNIALEKEGVWTIDKVENSRRALGGVEGSILDNYGGEYRFDNMKIELLQSRGEDRNVVISYGKNITSLEEDEDITNVATSIHPYASVLVADENSNEQNEVIITLPEGTIDAENAGNFARKKTVVMDFTDEEIKSEAALRSAALRYVKDSGLGLPKARLKVSFVDLLKTLEYKDRALVELIELCDLVYVYFPKYGIRKKTKVIKTNWDVLLEQYDTIELGTEMNRFSSAIPTVDGLKKQVESALEKRTFSILEAGRKAATDLINRGFGGFVRIYPDRILILDSEEEEQARKVWQWNKNGLGYSASGVNGPYVYAWTMDGQFNTQMIGANSITVNQLSPDIGRNLDIAGNVAFRGVLKKEDLPDLKGEPGQPGKDGADGAPGKDGVNGKDGLPGEKGDKGDPGLPGAPGKDGLPGKKGDPGEPGAPGQKGADGAQGPPGKDGDPGKPGKDGVNGKDGLQPNLLCVSTMEKGTLDANYGTMYPTENTGTSDYIPIEEPGEYTLTLFDEITAEEAERLGKTNRLVVLSYDKDKKMLDCLSYRDATYWNNMHGKITETYTIGKEVAYVRISTVLPQTHRYKFERGKESTGWIPHALDLVGPQGPPGPRGEPGEKGVSIASIKVQYDQRKVGTRPVSEEDQGDPPEPVTWSDEVPSWKKGYIVWRRFSITYSDGIVVRTAPESLTEEAARAALESAKAYTDSLEAAIAIRDYADKAYADGAVSKSEKAIMETLQQLLDATRAQVLDEVQKNVQGTFRGMLDRLDDLEGLIWMSNGTIYIGRKGQYEALTLTNSEIAFFVDAIKKGRLNPDDLLVTNARAVKWEFINEKEVSLYQQTTRLVDGVPHLTWYYVGG